MSRILGLDIGIKVVGIALTDESQTIVSPRPPIIRNNGSLRLGPFKKLISIFKIKTVVAGLPLHLDGANSKQGSKTKAFINKLKKHFPAVTFITVDERLSTSSVKKKYRRLKLAKNKSAANIDSFAAMEILEDFLGRD